MQHFEAECRRGRRRELRSRGDTIGVVYPGAWRGSRQGSAQQRVRALQQQARLRAKSRAKTSVLDEALPLDGRKIPLQSTNQKVEAALVVQSALSKKLKSRAGIGQSGLQATSGTTLTGNHRMQLLCQLSQKIS